MALTQTHQQQRKKKSKNDIKNKKKDGENDVPLHHLNRERVVDNGESRLMHFPSREILPAFGRDGESIQPRRDPQTLAQKTA